METIPSTYWMIIIGFVVLMICLVLYYLAMLLKETKKVVTDTGTLLKETDLILKDVRQVVASAKGTVDQINEAILVPIKRIGYGISMVTSFLNKDKKE